MGLTGLTQVVSVLADVRFTTSSERELQDAVARLLADAGIPAEREVLLDQSSRIDFLTAGGVGVEIKIGGSRYAALRQLIRYARSPHVLSLVLVTTIASHRQLPTHVGGKPCVALFVAVP